MRVDVGRLGKAVAIRMYQDEDVLTSLEAAVINNSMSAGAVVSIIGSIKRVNIRYYSRSKEGIRRDFKQAEGSYELVSGIGNFYVSEGKAVLHVHVMLTSATDVIGGHLVEGNIVDTTAQALIVELEGIDMKALLT